MKSSSTRENKKHLVRQVPEHKSTNKGGTSGRGLNKDGDILLSQTMLETLRVDRAVVLIILVARVCLFPLGKSSTFLYVFSLCLTMQLILSADCDSESIHGDREPGLSHGFASEARRHRQIS